MKQYGFNSDPAKVPVIFGSAKLELEETAETATDYGRKSIEKLMDTVDKIPAPPRANEKPLLMPIEDVFTIAGRGVVATGKVEQGTLRVGEEVSVVGFKPVPRVVISGIEMFRKQLDVAQAGDNVGALLRGSKKGDVVRGMIMCRLNSLDTYKRFRAKVYVLTADEGGRKKPFHSNYKPQFFIRTADVAGVVTLLNDKQVAMPGDNIELDVDLMVSTPIHEGQRIAIREGKVTVGAGVITKVFKDEPKTAKAPEKKDKAAGDKAAGEGKDAAAKPAGDKPAGDKPAAPKQEKK